MRCCSLIQDIILGIVPTEVVEPPVYNFYYAQLDTPTAGVLDANGAWTAGGTGFLSGEYKAFASAIQTNETGFSGVFQDDVNGFFFVWIALEAEPVGWTWDADVTNPNPQPIVWSTSGVISSQCWASGDMWIDPDTYTLLGFGNDSFSTSTLFPYINYSDPTFNATYADSVVACYGVGATMVMTYGVGVVTVNINNTLCSNLSIYSTDYITPNSTNLATTPC